MEWPTGFIFQNLYFLISPFFLHYKKWKTYIELKMQLNIEEVMKFWMQS